MKKIKDKLVDKIVLLGTVYTIGVFLAVLLNLFRVLGRIRILHWERFPNYRCSPKLYKNGLILVSNHPSLLEPFLLPVLFWKEYLLHPIQLSPWSTPDKVNYYDKWYWFWIRPLAIPIERGNKQEELRAFVKLRRILNSGGIVVIFPEGGRTCNGKHGEFYWSERGKKIRRLKDGVGLLVQKTGAAVLPTWVDGAENFLPNFPNRTKLYHAFPRFREKITIKIGEPMKFEKVKSSGEISQKLATILLHSADEEE
ncbi:MAG: hypothetical protein COT32_00805 [Candidatus Nealsonbacteria bacterium CG08_land_8_20_14_0_20_36_22]|uniref:Phospholipid/glycerol acyltransferase domain-containing protein n=1 Tax=Candidatus Nealsonbacteria bacterium CG08_land_8_20_14_0_20_36_22 TaxID=1974704 RepID=A0A2H0YP12_9BACT|nr:MAG: hypothetical protein COT32_00805 [Candidatus Nealsonbacteria bacterium CG08_land_8_20_14_0_20_36_22]